MDGHSNVRQVKQNKQVLPQMIAIWISMGWEKPFPFFSFVRSGCLAIKIHTSVCAFLYKFREVTLGCLLVGPVTKRTASNPSGVCFFFYIHSRRRVFHALPGPFPAQMMSSSEFINQLFATLPIFMSFYFSDG